MSEWLSQTWPWYVSGPLIGFTVPLLLLTGNKQLGVSSSLRHICAACLPANINYLKYDWKKQSWNLLFVAGLFVGGIIGNLLLNNHQPAQITQHTHTVLESYGIHNFYGLLPADLINSDSLFGFVGFSLTVIGGFLVGFGTRYANGCTSGHAIMGIANLQFASVIAAIGFFVGGMLMTHFIFPYLLR
ncbi:MAG: YeeE/YedE family protein [Calditrichaeota bacterium]|nr:YeeE/YedE family protein [Calditrichota bacterium]